MGGIRNLNYHFLHAFVTVHAGCVIRAKLCNQKAFDSDT